MEEILNLLNEWWIKESISKEKAKPYRREIYPEIRRLMKYRQIIILTGLRRTGKTTLIYQLIEDLLKSNVNPKNILYFNFDEKVEEILTILNTYKKLTGINWKEKRIFVFLDEIHKLKNWSSKLKLLYDALPNTKFVISGSASVMLEKEAISNLAGRYFLREVKPLSLKEFLELYFDKKIDLKLWEDEAYSLLPQYFRKPFPEIVRWKDYRNVNEYIRSLVIEKIVSLDLPMIFEEINIRLLSNLVEIFFTNPGMILNLTELANDLRVSKLTLERHIFYLEFSKLIRIVKNFRPSIRSESRKMKKIYPYHIALSYPFYPKLDEGKVFECCVASSLDLSRYWRKNGKEIDFVKVNKNILGIEVKSSKDIKPKNLKNLLYFMKKYNLKKSVVIYSGKYKKIKIENMLIELFPLVNILFYGDLKKK